MISDDLDTSEARSDRKRAILALCALIAEQEAGGDEASEADLAALCAGFTHAMIASDALYFGAQMLLTHARLLGQPVADVVTEMREKFLLGVDPF